MSFIQIVTTINIKIHPPLRQPETSLFPVAQPFNYGSSGHQRFGASTPEAEGRPV